MSTTSKVGTNALFFNKQTITLNPLTLDLSLLSIGCSALEARTLRSHSLKRSFLLPFFAEEFSSKSNSLCQLQNAEGTASEQFQVAMRLLFLRVALFSLAAECLPVAPQVRDWAKRELQDIETFRCSARLPDSSRVPSLEVRTEGLVDMSCGLLLHGKNIYKAAVGLDVSSSDIEKSFLLSVRGASQLHLATLSPILSIDKSLFSENKSNRKLARKVLWKWIFLYNSLQGEFYWDDIQKTEGFKQVVERIKLVASFAFPLESFRDYVIKPYGQGDYDKMAASIAAMLTALEESPSGSSSEQKTHHYKEKKKQKNSKTRTTEEKEDFEAASTSSHASKPKPKKD